jgi:hypothetical protein
MANPNKRSLACTVALIFGLMLSCAQFILVVRWGEEKVAAELQYISRIQEELSSMDGNVSTGKIGDMDGESMGLNTSKGSSMTGKAAEKQGSERYAGMKHILDEWMADPGLTGYDTMKATKIYQETVAENSCGAEEHVSADSPIWPLSGPEFGGTTVTVKLDAGAIVSDSGALCNFGGKQVPAVRVARELGGDACEFICACVHVRSLVFYEFFCMCVCVPMYTYLSTCVHADAPSDCTHVGGA